MDTSRRDLHGIEKNEVSRGDHLSNLEAFNTISQFHANITVLDNDDIIEAFQERNQRVMGIWEDSQDDIDRQKEFWNIFKSWNEFPKFHGFSKKN